MLLQHRKINSKTETKPAVLTDYVEQINRKKYKYKPELGTSNLFSVYLLLFAKVFTQSSPHLHLGRTYENSFKTHVKFPVLSERAIAKMSELSGFV